MVLILPFSDVIGIVKDTQELSVVRSKQTQKEVKKRDLTLVDNGGVVIRLTLWGTEVSFRQTTVYSLSYD